MANPLFHTSSSSRRGEQNGIEQAGDLKPDHVARRLTSLIRISNIHSESRPLIRLRFLERSAQKMKHDLPEPDTDSRPVYVSEEVVEMIFSPSWHYRAVITRDREGLFRIHRDYWCLSDYEYIGEGYWSQNDTLATITDTIESARKLAQETLDQTGDRDQQTTQPNKAE